MVSILYWYNLSLRYQVEHPPKIRHKEGYSGGSGGVSRMVASLVKPWSQIHERRTNNFWPFTQRSKIVRTAFARVFVTKAYFCAIRGYRVSLTFNHQWLQDVSRPIVVKTDTPACMACHSSGLQEKGPKQGKSRIFGIDCWLTMSFSYEILSWRCVNFNSYNPVFLYPII